MSGRRFVRACAFAGVVAAAIAVFALSSGAAEARIAFNQPAWGVDFVHAGNRGLDANHVEGIGSGVCVLDFDGDGWEDLFFPNVRYTDAALQAALDPRSALYRNLGDGRGFERVAGALEVSAWAIGCAVGDYDRDGRVDVALNTYANGSYLYRNLGGGAFANVTTQAGLDRHDCGDFLCFGSSLAFLDYDEDADLDLYAVNYVEWDGVDPRLPTLLPGQCNVMWRNDGDGTFTDVTAETGTGDCELKHLALAIADVDGNGYQDVFIANDGSNDTLLMNDGDGTFRDVSQAAGVADPRAGMGAAWGDYDGDGLYDLAITHFTDEGTALYRQGENLTFTDRAKVDGLKNSEAFLGWGVEFADLDLDGDLDLVSVNGAPNLTWASAEGYGQKNLVYENVGARFEDVSDAAWLPAPVRNSSRGLAVADLDQDGYLDLVISNNADEGAEVWRSERGAHNFLSLRLSGNATMDPHALGAVVDVEAGDVLLRREVVASSSYAGASTRDLQFGLGDATRVDRVVVRWPDGTSQTFGSVLANQLLTLTAGGDLSPLRERPLVTTAPLVRADRVAPVTLVADVLRAPTPVASHAWTVGGVTVEGAEPTLSFDRLGEHAGVLRVTLEDGTWDEAPFTVLVENLAPEPVLTPPPLIAGGASVALSGEASRDADGTVVAWSWLVEGVPYEGAVVEHAFTRPGLAEVRLTVTDDDGGNATLVAFLDVPDEAPVAALAAPARADRVTPAVLDASASRDAVGRIVAWRWDFGDGTRCAVGEPTSADPPCVGDGPTVEYRFASLGVFTVTVTVVDDGGLSASASADVLVVNVPPVAAVATERLANLDEALPYEGRGSSDADGRIVAWRWEFDDGTVLEGPEVAHALRTLGAHRVRLTVTDDDGAAASASWDLDVVDRLLVTVTWDAAAGTGLLAGPRGVVDVRYANGRPVADADVVVRVAFRCDAPPPAREACAVPAFDAAGRTDEDGRFGFEPPRPTLPTGARAAGRPVAWGEYAADALAVWSRNAGAGAGSARAEWALP